MGMRTHAIIRYTNDKHSFRSAMYMHWTYGPFMAVRAGRTIEFIENHSRRTRDRGYDLYEFATLVSAKSIFSLNPYTGDTQGVLPCSDASTHPATELDNEYGMFLLDITNGCDYTFGFVGPTVCDKELKRPQVLSFTEWIDQGTTGDDSADYLNGSMDKEMVFPVAEHAQLLEQLYPQHRMTSTTARELLYTPEDMTLNQFLDKNWPAY